VLKVAPQALWLELIHRPQRLINASGEEMPLEELKGRQIAAFCGIGNPAGFRHALASIGAQVAAWRELPDHCSYDDRMLGRLEDWLRIAAGSHVVCTRKDLVKIPHATLAGKQLWALAIGLEIVRGQEELERLLANHLPG
jgi:tetraacyldisaccharide 4'-kinase